MIEQRDVAERELGVEECDECHVARIIGSRHSRIPGSAVTSSCGSADDAMSVYSSGSASMAGRLTDAKRKAEDSSLEGVQKTGHILEGSA